MPQIKYTRKDALKMKLVEGYRVEDVRRDPGIIPFLIRIKTGLKEDIKILRLWQRHFTVYDEPFMVVKSGTYTVKIKGKEYKYDVLQLWKHGTDD